MLRHARMHHAHFPSFFACAYRLALSLLEVAQHPQQLATVDTADPRESPDLPTLDPPARGVGPLDAPAVTRDVATQAHHVGEDGSGRVLAKLAPGSRSRHLFHQPGALVQPSLIGEEQGAAHDAPGSKVPIVRAIGDPGRAFDQSECAREIAAGARCIGVRDREVAVGRCFVRERLRPALEQVLGALEPAHREGVLHVRDVLAPQREGTQRCSMIVAALQVGRVRGLAVEIDWSDRPVQYAALAKRSRSSGSSVREAATVEKRSYARPQAQWATLVLASLSIASVDLGASTLGCCHGEGAAATGFDCAARS
jgi:hypothetical protein